MQEMQGMQTKENELIETKILFYKDFLNKEELIRYLEVGDNTAGEIMKKYGVKIGRSRKILKSKLKEMYNNLDTSKYIE
jgi:hypothetical protein